MLDTPSTFTMLKTEVLYSKDSKNKLRVSHNTLTHDSAKSECTIHRTTGIKGGKLTDQPLKIIKKGKVKRTLVEQAVLEFEALIKKQKDKGYQSITDLGLTDKATDSDILSKLGSVKVSADGFIKPMLAKDVSVEDRKKVVTSRKSWLRSTKLDGIRVTASLVGESLVFSSRGGIEFQGVTEHFKNDPELIKLARFTGSQIDGEFYKHGINLEVISGICRMKDYDPVSHDWIEFHIFDLANTHMTAKQRAGTINQLSFTNNRIKVVKHTEFTNYDDIIAAHEKDLAAGYEGSILRNPDAAYGYGKRNKDMIKLKDFQDAEFEVIGYTEGLRPTTDMVFTLRLPDGRTFEAKPFGDDELKQKYIDNFNELKGQMGTVKFFHYSAEGIPILTSFKCFRPTVQEKLLF